jgi:signal transduction histidine kinase
MKLEEVFALESAGWPSLLLDGSGGIHRANAAAIQLLGPALEGPRAHLSAIWMPENGSPPGEFLTRWERSPALKLTLKLRAKDGQPFCGQAAFCAVTLEGQKRLLLQLFPQVSPALAADTNAVAADKALAHKQKLECALQLARTVALDFNNALTSILGHASLVLSQIEPSHPSRCSLLEIEKSAAWAAEIASDLGNFSRQEKEAQGTQSAGNLNLVLQRAVAGFRQTTGLQQVEWRLQLERRLFTARFDEAKLQQAFLKLLENAAQALHGPGHISAVTRNVELTQPTQDCNAPLAAGTYVCVEISDSGEGIAPEILPRIFEPFFTTRGGVHRGLGLAWVYGIVSTTAASSPFQASRAQALPCGFTCPPSNGLSGRAASPAANSGGIKRFCWSMTRSCC